MTRADATLALLDVRSLVERAWTQGAYCRFGSGEYAGAALPLTSKMHDQPERTIAYCVGGAIDIVSARHLLDDDELRALIVRELPPQYSRRDPFVLEHWNDAPERSVDDVLRVVDAALRRVGYVQGALVA